MLSEAGLGCPCLMVTVHGTWVLHIDTWVHVGCGVQAEPMRCNCDGCGRAPSALQAFQVLLREGDRDVCLLQEAGLLLYGVPVCALRGAGICT